MKVLLLLLALPLRAQQEDYDRFKAEAGVLIGPLKGTRTPAPPKPNENKSELAPGGIPFYPRPEEADAPYVPALPSTTPEEALGHLRRAVERGEDDQALGEAYDFLARWTRHPLRAEVRLAAGALHLRRGEPRRALAFLTPAAREGPAELRSKAAHLLGGALLALGRHAEVLKAVPAADPSASRDRWLALAQIWRAAAQEALGREEDAAERYRAVAASGHESPVRAYALAAVAADWERLGKPERARDALARAGREAQRWGMEELRDAAELSGAHALARARRLEEAAEAYGRFASERPRSSFAAQALYERGLALKRLERPEDAARAFESLLERHPRSAYAADSHLQLGQIYGELGRADEALAHYRRMARASEAKDADREALLLMAQLHYNAKRFAQAAPHYRRWLESAGEDARTREVRGLLLVSLWHSDREDAALPELAAKLPEHPLVAEIRWELAAKAYKRGDWAAADELFRRQLEAAPRGPRAAEARYYRAEALRQSGKGAEAAAAYRRFLASHPGDGRARAAWSALAGLLFAAGEHAGAAEAYARVTGADGEAADAAYNRALALAKAGKPSAQAFEDFAARFPKHERAPQAWLSAAKSREEAGESEKAAAGYAKAGSPAALYALGRLREKLKQGAAARAAYEKLRDAEPKDDPARVAGLLRLALLLELGDRPKDAAPLYLEVMRRSARGGESFESARKRLQALTGEKALLGSQ